MTKASSLAVSRVETMVVSTDGSWAAAKVGLMVGAKVVMMAGKWAVASGARPGFVKAVLTVELMVVLRGVEWAVMMVATMEFEWAAMSAVQWVGE